MRLPVIILRLLVWLARSTLCQRWGAPSGSLGRFSGFPPRWLPPSTQIGPFLRFISSKAYQIETAASACSKSQYTCNERKGTKGEDNVIHLALINGLKQFWCLVREEQNLMM